MRRLGAWTAAAVTVAALVTVPGLPARADVEMYDPVVLAQSGDGDVVHLPGTHKLVVAGGDESPVVVVDLLERSVDEVEGTEGVRTLDLDQEGHLLHGTTQTTGEVLEIDPWTDAAVVTRRWFIPDACLLNGAVMRGGAIWVSQSCGERRLRRLDPASGSVSVSSANPNADSVVGEPNGPGLYTLVNSTSAVVTHVVAENGALTEVDSLKYTSFSQASQEQLRISEDGSMLFLPANPLGTKKTVTWAASTLTPGPTWSNATPVLWANAEVVGGYSSHLGQPTLLDRDTFTEINRFLPDDTTSVVTSDVRLVGDELAATVRVGDEKRVYVVDEPTTSEPALTVSVPWGETGVNTPTSVEGTLVWNGDPVADQELVLSEVEPTRRVLATVTTDPDGSWQATWTPATTGAHVLEVRYSGTRESVARRQVYVEEVYQRVDLSAPASVDGGDTIPVTATATRNGLPAPGVEVSLRRWDVRSTKWNATDMGTLTTDEQGVARFSLPPGAVDRWFIEGEWTFPDGYHWRSDGDTLVVDVVRQPTTVEIGDTPATALAGDPVEVPIKLTTGQGEPLDGQTVELYLTADTDSTYATVTTGQDGTATYIDTLTGEGLTSVRATFPGTLTLDDSDAQRDTVVRHRVQDPLTVKGPAEGEVGVPLTISGSLEGADGPLGLTILQDSGPQTTITTAADGTWTTEVTPALPGTNRFVVRFAGNDRIAEDVVVHTVTTPLAQPVITLDPVDVRVGEMLRLRGTVTGLVRPSEVEVRQDGVLIGPRSVGVDGVLDLQVATFLQPTQHLYEVTVVANERQEPASASVAVEVEPVPTLSNELRGGTTDTRFPGYRIYDAGVRPRLSSSIRPRDEDSCVERVVERFRSHHWREVERQCLNYAGERRLGTRLPDGPSRVRFRVRTELADPVRPTITSTWSLYRFRR